MSCAVVNSKEMVKEGFPRPLVFLGGDCRGRDWRFDFFHRFERSDVTFFNPNNEAFPDPDMDPAGHMQQVSWEKRSIDQADICVFWLGQGLSNQASRVEIGYAIGRGKPVLIGAEPGFMGGEHLASFSGLVLSSSIDGLQNRFASLLASFNEG